ncbi:MAG: TolC family protein [Nitrospirota bacterium]|nr:TolC family protein [Nitrospirota bacterium]
MGPGKMLWCHLFVFSTLLMTLPGNLLAEKRSVSKGRVELPPLIQEALEHNPELVAAQAQVAAMQERIPQSKSLEDPEFTIRLWNTPENLDVTRSDRTIYGLAQRFPFPGTLSQQEHIAGKVVEQAKQRLAQKKLELIAAVKVAYYELFYAHKAIEIHHEQNRRLRQFFESATAKFRAGKGTQVDVLKAQVELSKWFQHLPVLEQQRKTAQARMNMLLDRNTESPLGVPLEPTWVDKDLSLDQVQKQALQNRPEIREAALVVEQFDATIKLAELYGYPQLRIELQRWQNYNTDDGFGGSASINLPFSFWTKPKYEAGVREAIAEREEARFKKKTWENLTGFEIQDLMAQRHAKGKILKLYKTTVLPQAKLTLKAANAGYRTDRTDFLDLIDADRAWLTYQLEYVRTLVDWAQLLAKLERVVGAEL